MAFFEYTVNEDGEAELESGVTVDIEDLTNEHIGFDSWMEIFDIEWHGVRCTSAFERDLASYHANGLTIGHALEIERVEEQFMTEDELYEW